MSEVTWCAYAWPEKIGETGNRAFFVNQSRQVLFSHNQVALWEGAAHAPEGRSAFRGEGITSMPAVGTAGRDGDVWLVTN